MNGLAARNKTLGELMTELRSRLGFVAQGAASKGNEAIIKSFLQEAHDYVYSELEMSSLRKKATIAIEPGGYLYDWHNDAEDEPIDPTRVLSMWLRVSESQRDQLRQGITEADRGMESERGQPTRYDHLNGQIELYPVPDRGYGLIIEYTADAGRFDRPADRCSVPHRLVFQYALATAKAHYRHPDAEAPASTFKNMLAKEKMRQKENRRFFGGGAAPCSTPQVVRNGEGSYSLKVG